MHTDASVDPVVLLGVRDGGVQFFGPWARANGQDGLDSRRAGTVEHGVPVLGELRKVDVRMGVDEPHGILALCVGDGELIHEALRAAVLCPPAWTRRNSMYRTIARFASRMAHLTGSGWRISEYISQGRYMAPDSSANHSAHSRSFQRP